MGLEWSHLPQNCESTQRELMSAKFKMVEVSSLDLAQDIRGARRLHWDPKLWAEQP